VGFAARGGTDSFASAVQAEIAGGAIQHIAVHQDEHSADCCSKKSAEVLLLACRALLMALLIWAIAQPVHQLTSRG